MKILCLDAGSSSLKFSTYRAAGAAAEAELLTHGEHPSLDLPTDAGNDVDAVGHRIVFGGARYTEPTRVGPEVLRDLEAFVPIEPLHMRSELDLVYAAQRRFPGALHVLCFDTAFHQASPAIAKQLPLPGNLDPLIRRYGFHGLSYEYIATQLPPGSGRTIVAHLGSGASMCAMHDGKPVDTTMGFSPLGGLMMGTRPGDLDPAIILRLIDDGYDRARLGDLFYHQSGLLGVSESTPDMRILIARSGTDERARAAIELFVYQLVKHIGALSAVLGGLDTLVFTAGIGENQPLIRDAVRARIGYLGPPKILVIPTNENLVIARHTAALAIREGIVKPSR